MERDDDTIETEWGGKISTHTLTWSVTFKSSSSKTFFFISTHTLTWSVTLGNIGSLVWCGNFNSHAHVERDSLMVNFGLSAQDFNSHAHVERDFFVTVLLSLF